MQVVVGRTMSWTNKACPEDEHTLTARIVGMSKTCAGGSSGLNKDKSGKRMSLSASYRPFPRKRDRYTSPSQWSRITEAQDEPRSISPRLFLGQQQA
jgi:hypothetical protein